MPDLTEITREMGSRGAVVPGKKLRLDFGSDGAILLDGVDNRVSNDAGEADATIRLSFANFLKLAEGSLNPVTAFMTGRIRIDGDMGVAMQFQSVAAKIKP